MATDIDIFSLLTLSPKEALGYQSWTVLFKIGDRFTCFILYTLSYFRNVNERYLYYHQFMAVEVSWYSKCLAPDTGCFHSGTLGHLLQECLNTYFAIDLCSIL